MEYSREEFAKLIVRASEGELTEADHLRLVEILRTNPAAREEYVGHMLLQGQLEADSESLFAAIESHSQGPGAPFGSDTPTLHAPIASDRATATASRENSQSIPPVLSHSQSLGWDMESAGMPGLPQGLSRFFSLSPSALGMLIAVFFGILVGRWYFGTPSGIVENKAERNELTPVAYLTSANGCAWGSGITRDGAVGSGVHLGDEITLYEGIAEFRLSSGVSLSIEGPAALAVTSPTSLILQHGKVTVHVPWSVVDFRLLAASCHITACEAEFGVHVAGGKIDVHAFSGQVLMSPVISGIQRPELVGTSIVEQEADLAPGSEFSEVIIAAGRGLSVINKGEIVNVSRWHSAKKTEFATKLPMAGSLPIDRGYVDAVMLSKPVDYWRFEESINGAVANEIAGQPSLKISGEVRFVRGAKNHAAELGRTGSAGFLYCETPSNLPSGSDYSIELWMKPSHIHDGSIVSLTPDLTLLGRERHAFYLQLCGPHISYPENGRCRVRYLHRDPPQSDFRAGTSCYSAELYALRRWQHVACVKNGAEMRLYLNGTLVAKQQETGSLADNLYLVIGQAGAARRVHPFIGQLDELAIYDRALSQTEVALHVQAVDWEPNHVPPVKIVEF